jgi:hypothetical protein
MLRTDAPREPSRQITPPRAGAVAGILFSVLMIVSLTITRLAPHHPAVAGKAIRLAVHLVPFAGVAFLWFIGVVRARIGASEDQFFATVFLGSGLLFAGCLFASAAVAGALLDRPDLAAGNYELYYFARRVSYTFLNVFGIRMAGVFIFSTCTIALRTAILPRSIALSGFVCGVLLLTVISSWLWIALLFPAWIGLVSGYVLVREWMRD